MFLQKSSYFLTCHAAEDFRQVRGTVVHTLPGVSLDDILQVAETEAVPGHIGGDAACGEIVLGAISCSRLERRTVWLVFLRTFQYCAQTQSWVIWREKVKGERKERSIK
jgi:hypothetical protein